MTGIMGTESMIMTVIKPQISNLVHMTHFWKKKSKDWKVYESKKFKGPLVGMKCLFLLALCKNKIRNR